MQTPLFKPLIVAFIFLTRIPMPQLNEISPQDSGRALAYFPLVGAAIGAALLIISHILPLSPLLIAAVLVCFWVFVTGGLHIDGLGDSADGWLGGLADKERTLRIMKDPVCGSAAVMTVGCLLLLKLAALATLIEQQSLIGLLLAPIIGRCVPLILFLTTPYVSKNGLAEHFIAHADTQVIKVVLVAVLLLSLLLTGFTTSLITFSLVAITLFALRRLMMARLGGNTGDTTGASVEIIEALTLIGFSLA